MTKVTLVDTSILCELLRIPGKSDDRRWREVSKDFDARCARGEHLVIPVTAVIETGNHIAQSDGDRYRLATALVKLLRAGMEGQAPWRVTEPRLGRGFLEALCAGASTGKTFEDLAAAKIGAGDVAILVERDQLLAGTAIESVDVWTFDTELRSHAGAP